MRVLRLSAAGWIGLVLAGCGSGGSGASSPSRGAITAGELQGITVSDCYEAVFQLRPQWLRRTRGAPTPQNPNPTPGVVVDGTPRGELDELRRIGIIGVQRIEFLTARDATTKYGTGFPAGAIEITTRR